MFTLYPADNYIFSINLATLSKQLNGGEFPHLHTNESKGVPFSDQSPGKYLCVTPCNLV